MSQKTDYCQSGHWTNYRGVRGADEGQGGKKHHVASGSRMNVGRAVAGSSGPAFPSRGPLQTTHRLSMAPTCIWRGTFDQFSPPTRKKSDQVQPVLRVVARGKSTSSPRQRCLHTLHITTAGLNTDRAFLLSCTAVSLWSVGLGAVRS